MLPSREPTLEAQLQATPRPAPAVIDIFDFSVSAWRRGVPLAEAFPEDEDRSAAVADLAAEGFAMVGGGAAPAFLVIPAAAS